MYSKHPVSRTDSAVGARSSSTRISVLVGNRQDVDEIDLRLCVRRQPLVDEGRHDCNAAGRPALDKVSWHFGQRLSVVSLSWTWRPDVRSRASPNTDVSTPMCVKWLTGFPRCRCPSTAAQTQRHTRDIHWSRAR